MRKLIILFLVIPILFLSAYASNTTYSGQWIHVKYPSIRLDVSEKGATWLVTEFRDKSSKKFPAKLVDNSLTVSNGPMQQTIVIEVKTGNLIFNGQEFRRLRKGETIEYKAPVIPRF